MDSKFPWWMWCGRQQCKASGNVLYSAPPQLNCLPPTLLPNLPFNEQKSQKNQRCDWSIQINPGFSLAERGHTINPNCCTSSNQIPYFLPFGFTKHLCLPIQEYLPEHPAWCWWLLLTRLYRNLWNVLMLKIYHLKTFSQFHLIYAHNFSLIPYFLLLNIIAVAPNEMDMRLCNAGNRSPALTRRPTFDII